MWLHRAVQDRRGEPVTRHFLEAAKPSPRPRCTPERMTAASHKRVRVVSACDVTVPPACELATPCDAAVDDTSDGAGSATDDRGDDFPGAYGSGTDSVLDLAQPQAQPLGSTGAPDLVVRAAARTPSTPCPDALAPPRVLPDALRRIRSHSLLFGACVGAPAPHGEGGLGLRGLTTSEPSTVGASTASSATHPHHVWTFLQEQRLADLVTCSVSVRATRREPKTEDTYRVVSHSGNSLHRRRRQPAGSCGPLPSLTSPWPPTLNSWTSWACGRSPPGLVPLLTTWPPPWPPPCRPPPLPAASSPRFSLVRSRSAGCWKQCGTDSCVLRSCSSGPCATASTLPSAARCLQ